MVISRERMKKNTIKIEVGDIIIFKHAKKNEQHEVVKIEGKTIWYNIKNGIGQTIESSIETIIKPKKHNI
jgi:hypothetical protein